jgi:RNA-binding protein
MTIQLSPLQRKALKARAHRLAPVVLIGDKGLTDAVMKEIDISLRAHELIKVRIASDDRVQREAALGSICEALDAAAVQHIGKIVVVYRENPPPPPSPPVPVRRKLERARKPAQTQDRRRVSAARSAATTRVSRPTRTR